MMNNINLQIDAAARQVSQNGKAVYLTQTEFDLLLYLLDNAGRITTRSELLAQVWGITAPIHTRTVDMHIAKLRHQARRADRDHLRHAQGVCDEESLINAKSK